MLTSWCISVCSGCEGGGWALLYVGFGALAAFLIGRLVEHWIWRIMTAALLIVFLVMVMVAAHL